jgi:hypothetical protein
MMIFEELEWSQRNTAQLHSNSSVVTEDDQVLVACHQFVVVVEQLFVAVHFLVDSLFVSEKKSQRPKPKHPDGLLCLGSPKSPKLTGKMQCPLNGRLDG